MRALILPLLVVLPFGLSVQERGQNALFITTTEEGSITLYTTGDDGREEQATVLGTRALHVCVPEGTGVAVEDLDRAEVQVQRLDDGRFLWEGDLEVHLVREVEVDGRLRVLKGTVTLGPVETVSPISFACD